MTTIAPHTPLEALFLFQALHPFTAELPSFNTISETLKSNEFLRGSKSYDAERLSADALRDLSLRAVKEEAKIEAAAKEKTGPEKDGHNPRKRKITSPTLETASQHNHLLPQLVDRLYVRYREQAIKSIEDEERKYRLLQRDIQEIERGEWDARLQHQEITSKRPSSGRSSIQNLLREDSGLEAPVASDKNQTAADDVSDRPQHEQNGEVPRTEAAVRTESTLSSQDPSAPEAAKDSRTSPYHARSSSTTETQPPRPSPGVQPGTLPAENAASFAPPHPYPYHGYPAATSQAEGNRMQPAVLQAQSGKGLSPSPRLNQAPPVPERSSQSPIILPPPAGMLRSSGSPGGSLDALADAAGQQYRPSATTSSPRPGQPAIPPQHPMPHSQQRNYPPRPYPQYEGHPIYPVQYSPYGQGPLPAYGSPNHAGMPPYQPSPHHAHYHPPHPTYGQYPVYPQGYYQQTPVRSPYGPSHAPQYSDPRTPVPSSSAKRKVPQPSPIVTSASSTKWKNTETTSARSRTPTPPIPEEFSPITDHAPSPEPETGPHDSAAVSEESKQDFTLKRPTDRAGSQIKRGRGRGRGGSTRGRGTRAASSTSSQHIPTRSPSHADPIKGEPATPRAVDDASSIASPTADESTARKSVRRRRETIRGLEITDLGRPATTSGATAGAATTASTSSKRKRDALLTPPPPFSPSITSPPVERARHRPGQVLGSRNFPRTSATVMNDISSHKLAAMFAKPLTERDAPGYKSLILRPQDLKSIKSAIGAGGRAFVAAADNAGAVESGSPGSGTPAGVQWAGGSAKGASAWVPATPDVQPPKGIVNSGQLVKELMRMFANAVMFNPDPKRGVGPAFNTRRRAAERT